ARPAAQRTRSLGVFEVESMTSSGSRGSRCELMLPSLTTHRSKSTPGSDWTMNSQPGVTADPELIAHRGGLWPGMSENTLQAVGAAAQAAVHWMEADVPTGADGVLFAAHDSDLQRIAGRPESIRELPADELDEIELVAGGRLPRLESLFEARDDVEWHIHVQARHSIGPKIRCVRTSDAAA